MRFNANGITTNVPSSTFVDCTGLRLCNALLPSFLPDSAAAGPCQPECAGMLETEVPVDPIFPVQAFDLNLAGRYTD